MLGRKNSEKEICLIGVNTPSEGRQSRDGGKIIQIIFKRAFYESLWRQG